jgi:hypothetical protein
VVVLVEVSIKAFVVPSLSVMYLSLDSYAPRTPGSVRSILSHRLHGSTEALHVVGSS